MDHIKKHNIRLLNLIDYGHSGRTLLRVINEAGNEIITQETILKVLGETPTAKSIIKDFQKIDADIYSINCLIYFDINMLIVDKLAHYCSSINQLSQNLEIIDVRSFNSNTKSRIMFALKELGFETCMDLKEELLKEISSRETLHNNELKTTILNKYKQLQIEEYDQCINQMVKQKLIVETTEGLKISRPKIYDYFSSSTNEKDKIILIKLQGGTFQEVADKIKVSKQYISLMIKQRLPLYPVFHDEEKYRQFLSQYDINTQDLVTLGYDNIILIEYIKLKYKLHPEKDLLSYIEDYDLYDSEVGQKELHKRNLIIIDGDLVRKNFIEIFKRFILLVNLHYFNLESIASAFNEYLDNKKIYDDKLYIRKNCLLSKSNMISRDPLFLNVKYYEFLLFKPEELSYEFTESCDNYLSEFEGYGSVEWFFNRNDELCRKNNINDENQLFTLLKKLFSEKYNDKIDFIRNPIIAVKGINKELFIENLILDLEMPCTVDKYLSYVNEQTGLKKSSISSNFYNVLIKYKNVDGLITLDDDISIEEKRFLENFLEGKRCIGYKFLQDLVDIKYGHRAQVMLNKNVLKKLGYTKTNTSIYLSEYSNRNEAVNDVIKDLDFIIDENELSRIANKEYFYYKGCGYVEDCSLVQISKQKYLNILKRRQTSLIKRLKNQVLKSISAEEIIEFNDYINSSRFRKILEKDEDTKTLINSFGDHILKFIIMTIKEISCIETDTSLIFSKGDLTIGSLLYNLLSEKKSISLLDLQELLNDEYGICHDIPSQKLSEIGLYCPLSSDKVYLSKEYYEKELEEILKNGNFGSQC